MSATGNVAVMKQVVIVVENENSSCIMNGCINGLTCFHYTATMLMVFARDCCSGILLAGC
jgi:hypothetical protein